MSNSNCIRITLNIKDQNIIFGEDYIKLEVINKIETQVYTGILSPPTPKKCKNCGNKNKKNSLIKNGSKMVTIKIPSVSYHKAILRLKKQRYLCKKCNQTFCAETDLVERNRTISNNTSLACLVEAKDKTSIKDIAKRFNISPSTLNNRLGDVNKAFKINYNYLPENLSFDEFKSVKSVLNKMSFIYADSENGKIIDIVQNRRLSYLKAYFFRYPLEVRQRVKTVCIDMYEPYIQLIISCFPNARIITDRFHIVQHINRALNSARVAAMKDNKEYYARYKRYWKLLLVDHANLDCTEYKKYVGYPHFMTASGVVADLLTQDKTLASTYWLSQYLKQAIRSKNIEEFKRLITTQHVDICPQIETVLKTFRKQENYIINALSYSFSNGRLEGTNNLIKVIKRIAFGYRNFFNFRSRILLISNTMLELDL